LAGYTSIGIGGSAPLYIPKSLDELKRFIDLHRHYRCIGSGTNILLTFDKSNIPFISLGNFSEIKKYGDIFCVGAGCLLSVFAKYTTLMGYTGLEWAVYAYGTVGGAIIGNAAMYRNNPISSKLAVVTTLRGGSQDFTMYIKDELKFRYRECSLPCNDIIVNATFCLTKGSSSVIEKKLRLAKNVRRAQLFWCKGYKRFGNFWKDYHIIKENILDIQVLETDKLLMPTMLPGWILNKGSATAKDILLFADAVEKDIQVKLRREVIVY